MKSVILSLVLAVTLPVMAFAQSASDAIKDTINGQFSAFQADDFETAFGYASPMIQGLFGSPDRFGMMVRNGYPMVWRPNTVKFLELRDQGGRVFQKILVQDEAGAFHVLDYQMVPGENGWKINGVQLLPAPDLGV